jgi:hypothetical protein
LHTIGTPGNRGHLEDGGSHSLWEVDPGTGNVTLLADQSGIPALAQARAMNTVLIKPAVSLPGFIILFRKHYHWNEEGSNDNQLLIMRDGDLNGTIDESAVITWGDWATRGYWANEDPNYT